MRKVWVGLGVGTLIAAAVAFYLALPWLTNVARPTLAEVGGTRIILEIDPSLDAAAAEAAVKGDTEIIERRLDGMNWQWARVRRDGARRMIVEVPDVFDKAHVARIVAARGDLAIRFVQLDAPPDAPKVASIDPTEPSLPLMRRRIIDNSHIVYSRPGLDTQTNAPIVNLRFNAAGAKAFARETTENVGRQMAMVLDDKILMAPRILGPITGGAVQISGNFTTAQAAEVATLLGSGALPAPVTVKTAEEVAKPGR